MAWDGTERRALIRRAATMDRRQKLTPPLVSFSGTPLSVLVGQAVNLSWSTQYASKVTLQSGVGTVAVAASGSLSVSPNTSMVYTLTATGADGVVTAQVSVEVKPLPVANGIPASFFGVHLNGLVRWGTKWPTLSVVTTDRFWDSGTGMPWPGSPAESVMDQTVAIMQAHNCQILFCFGQRNQPALTGVQWTSLVTHVVQRYKGKIFAYEIWNEPDADVEGSGTGITVAHMVQQAKILHDIVKANDPAALVVGPSCQGVGALNVGHYVDQFFTAGGGAYIDVVSHHFYDSSGGNWIMQPYMKKTRVDAMRARMAAHGIVKPIWNTEENALVFMSDDHAIAFIWKTYIMSRLAGLSRTYWHAYDSSPSTAPQIYMRSTSTGENTPVANAYGKMVATLTGAVLGAHAVAADGTHTVPITLKDGSAHVITWNDATQPIPVIK